MNAPALFLLGPFVFVVLAPLACAGGRPVDARYPPLKEGCAVQVFPETPLGNTDNLGPVMASCDESVTDDDCQRTLKDEVCKLGGNLVWGVQSETKNGKKSWFGRAAHSK